VAISKFEPSSDSPTRLASDQNSSAPSERSLQLAVAAAHTARENKGQDVVILDLRDLTPICDYFVIATGTSRRQLHAMSDEIDHKLEDDLHDQRLGIEGYDGSSWLLLDFGSIVVHLFDAETREYYAIEDLWAEARRVDWESMSR
jgi:ribosome-associated protein